MRIDAQAKLRIVLMWLRTLTHDQYRYGGTLRGAVTTRWAEGGALASNVHVAVAVSSNAGPEGKVCCAQADCLTCPGGTTCTECEASKYLDPTTGTCVTPRRTERADGRQMLESNSN